MKKTILLILVLLLSLAMAVEFAKADFTFGEHSKLPPPVNLPGYTSGAPSISSDGLSLFFTSDMPGQYGNYDLWVTTRAAIDDEWGEPQNLGQTVNSSAAEAYPEISSDGLSLFFQDGHPVWPELPLRPGGCGLGDLWVTKREMLADAWGTPENLGPTVNGSYWDGTPCISADGLVLYFTSNRPGGSGGYDIWLATRKTKDEDWGAPINLGPTVNSTDWEYGVSVSSDGLALFFMSVGGSVGYGGCDLWMTTRVGTDQEWDAPVNLGPTVNSSIWEYRPSISACFPGSGCRLYFTRRPGMDPPSVIWETKISPIVDLNGDGIVDSADMCIMIDYWGTDEPLCDIGPMPWGDGIVDVQDLIVLAEHLFEIYPSAETVEVNEDNDGGQVELEQGQILVVTLESNPSTGYRWELVENNESILKHFGQSEFKSSDPTMVGAGGWEIFRFKAVSAGQMTLELVYHRSWEDVEPLKTYSIQVTVN